MWGVYFRYEEFIGVNKWLAEVCGIHKRVFEKLLERHLSNLLGEVWGIVTEGMKFSFRVLAEVQRGYEEFIARFEKFLNPLWPAFWIPHTLLATSQTNPMVYIIEDIYIAKIVTLFLFSLFFLFFFFKFILGKLYFRDEVNLTVFLTYEYF